ncbi:alpha/beta fold hydrolase [Gymnodinialimonas hymeniacidonis]|uniref:alpha/beta fold hydrolase n=1 Tax=Gymnodinialimonas hymeniacidonis TaxID=3126508 RepID=UPI0034C5B3F2
MSASAFLEGFALRRVAVPGVELCVAVAGEGPAVLLLHGHPQTHVVWRKVAPALVAMGYTVVAPDLRGYGDSGKPDGGTDHAGYSKRVIAADNVSLMAALGHERFSVIGHDRGGRVAHRMALDHPQVVERVMVLDIAPTLTMYERTDMNFARDYFWWFFLIQPFDLPERMIGADPEYFLRRHVDGQVKVAGAVNEDVIAEYLRTYRDPATIHAICEDYRAAASIDLEHDRADAEARMECPLWAIWGSRGVVGRTYDVAATWREKARDVTGVALDCGHAIPEEVPEALLAEIGRFLGR